MKSERLLAHWPMHLSGQREPYLELFAQVCLREEHNENSAESARIM